MLRKDQPPKTEPGRKRNTWQGGMESRKAKLHREKLGAVINAVGKSYN